MSDPVCDTCARAIPDGVDRVAYPGLVICGPCLWERATPGWREHLRHAEPWETCQACQAVPVGGAG